MSSQHAEMQTCPSCGELVPREYVVCVWCGFDLTAEHIRRSGITIGNREAVFRMRRVIVDPLTIFKEIALLPDLRGGYLILYSIGLMMTFNMIAVLSKLEGISFNQDLGNLITLTSGGFGIGYKFIINIAFIVVQPLVLLLIFMIIWRIATRILSLLSRSFGGKGDREKIRAAIGYSLLPVLFGWTLAWLVRLIAPAEEVQSATYENIQSAVVAVAEQGFGVVAVVFLYIGWIWAIILGIIGMKHAGRLSWIEAVIVAGIPYALFMTIVL